MRKNILKVRSSYFACIVLFNDRTLKLTFSNEYIYLLAFKLTSYLKIRID